ncbi:hypothetical protein [Kiloniella sp.]|uniref:hypothetical protein n=1 Tax=Kiloniella sp. TaxID=1938587 RepID=UPI003A958727
MQNNKLTLLLDQPPRWTLCFLLLLKLTGISIHVIDKDSVRKFPEWNKAIKSGKIQLTPPLIMAPFHSQAIAQAEHIVMQCKSHKGIQGLQEILSDTHADILVKKILAEDLLRFLFILSIANESKKTFLFSPKNIELIYLCQKYGFIDELKNLNTNKIIMFGRCISHFLNTFKKWAKYITRRLAISNNKIDAQPIKTKKHTQRISFALNTSWLMKFQGPRKFDFIIDNKNILKKDILFLREYQSTRDNLIQEENADYVFFNTSDSSIKLLNKKIISIDDKTRFNLLKILSLSLASQFEALNRALIIAFDELIHSENLSQNTSLKVYIYTNKEDTNQIAKNICLRKHNIESLSYPLFIGSPAIFAKEGSRNDSKDIIWYGLNPNYMLLYSKDAINSHKKHTQDVQNYLSWGSPFSQMIQNLDRVALRKKYLKLNSNPAIIISIFDTTYIDSPLCRTNYTHGIMFLEHIYQISCTENCHIFFKPSKNDNHFVDPSYIWFSDSLGQKLINVRRKLQKRNNVTLLPETADPTEVIAISDLTITDGLSSPTADALCANIPAFWYDPDHSHHGYPFDFTSFIIHGPSDLSKTVQDLIKNKTLHKNINKNEYFEKFISNNIENNFIDKFRALILKYN